MDYEGSQDDLFIPNRKAKHRVPKTFSDSNPQQKEVKKNKGKKSKNETSDEESSEDEIQVNMGNRKSPVGKGEAAFGFKSPGTFTNNREGMHMQWMQSSVY